MTAWVCWLADRWRRLGMAVSLCTALGIAVALVRLTASDDPLAAWGLGLRTGLGAWIVWASAVTLRECLGPAVAAHDGAPRRLPWTSGARVLGAAATVLAVSLARSPARAVVNLLGFALIGGVLLWVVARRANGPTVTRAALAFTLLALVPTHVNLPRPPERILAAPGSAFRWTVGWPTDDWRLRYEIALDRPLSSDLLQLWAQHAEGAAQSPGRIGVLVNGAPIGELAPRGQDWFALDLPASALAGQTHLRIELWQTVPDRRQRLLAHRWSGGATLGASASSYFDGRAWHTGTFDDAAGSPRAGAYVIELRGRSLWR